MAKQQVAFMYETNAAFSLSVLSLLMTMLLLGGIWLYWLTAEPKSGTRDPDDVAIDTLLPDETPLKPREMRVRTTGEWTLPGSDVKLPVQSLD